MLVSHASIRIVQKQNYQFVQNFVNYVKWAGDKNIVKTALTATSSIRSPAFTVNCL